MFTLPETCPAKQGEFAGQQFQRLFLRNWRPTLIIGLAIPLSLITTFIAFYLAGYTLNLLTLGGLALGVGRMVDDSIVVIENTFRHIELGESRKEAAIRGASEVGMAVTASTLTTIVVFFPMVVASGITAKLTRAPAGIKNHHAYLGGLLEHVVNLMEVVLRVSPCYPQLDRDMLLFGAFLHDLGCGAADSCAVELCIEYRVRSEQTGHFRGRFRRHYFSYLATPRWAILRRWLFCEC